MKPYFRSKLNVSLCPGQDFKKTCPPVGFEQVVEGLCLKSGDGILAMCGHKHNRGQNRAIGNILKNSESVGSGNLHVKKKQRRHEIPNHFRSAQSIAAFAEDLYLGI